MRTLLIYFKTSKAENMSSAVFYVSEVDIKTLQQTFQVWCGKLCSFTDVHIFFTEFGIFVKCLLPIEGNTRRAKFRTRFRSYYRPKVNLYHN